MANEIKIQASLACSKGSFVFPLVGAKRLQFDQLGQGGGAPGLLLIGSADQAIDLSAIETPGWLYMFNFDEFQSVLWGPEHAGAIKVIGELRAGEPALFRIRPGATLRMMVDPATEDSGSSSGENAARVQIYVLED